MEDKNYFGTLGTETGLKSTTKKLKNFAVKKRKAVQQNEEKPKKEKNTKKKKEDAKQEKKEKKSDKNHVEKDGPRWLSADESKRWGELFYLYYSIAWISFFAVIVVFKVYEYCGNYGYTAIGLIVCVPCFLIPWLFPGEYDRQLPLSQRYWVKANIWIATISFIGNYFWTHYFYVVLKAKYTFPTTWELNGVPIYLYLITHAYFHTYHTFSNVLIRRFRTGRFYTTYLRYDWLKLLANVIMIGTFSIIIAFMEAFSISSVPYYSYPNKYLMYTVGSMFYGIYFYVSFPMFYRLDEPLQQHQQHEKKKKASKRRSRWTLGETFVDALAACMLVTIILDVWRLGLGPIIHEGGRHSTSRGVPFVWW